MTTTQIQILTQVTQEGKHKGGFTFILDVDNDVLELAFLYAKENAIDVIKEFLVKNSNSHIQYEYITHEIQFHQPVELCTTEEFTEAFQKAIN